MSSLRKNLHPGNVPFFGRFFRLTVGIEFL